MRTTRVIRGFSLIELIIVMMITGVIMAGSSIVLSEGFQNYFTAEGMTGLNTRAAIAMTRMTKELQQASSISSMSSTSVTFVTTGGSTITYSWATPTLTRTGIGAETLNNEVTSFALTYYQANFSTTATASSVWAITINALFSNGSASIPLINTIYLKNM